MGKKIKILIVEDEILTAVLLKRNLELVGYAVSDPAATGEAALRTIETEQPDVVLLDIRLKGEMDGLELAEKITLNYQLPLIFMSGYSDQSTLKKAEAFNPAAYLIKPLTPDDIVPVLNRIFEEEF